MHIKATCIIYDQQLTGTKCDKPSIMLQQVDLIPLPKHFNLKRLLHSKTSVTAYFRDEVWKQHRRLHSKAHSSYTTL